MHIVFDVMGTVLGAIDMSLRPGIKETIKGLLEAGNRVDFWTSGPVDYYTAMLRENGIPGMVHKKEMGSPLKPDICVDDEPQDWFPGLVYRVKPHICGDLPGENILVAELICCKESNSSFFWD
ncbi:MAG: hypothetical protein HY893_09780 [Deltaproteobacteria bacterium]|nr:hypothetical protein [Deltaproteobacteria bacterium]